MSTSSDPAGRSALRYLLASIACAGFGAVYEHFSHGVDSFFMIYMFLFPLVGGALPFGMLSVLAKPELCPGRGCRTLYACGIATLTVGSCMRGVMDIFGTVSLLVPIYWIAGGALAGAALAWYFLLVRLFPPKKNSAQS